MSDRHGSSAKFNSPRQVVLPPFSNRTLHHPSFLPLYMAAMGSAQYPWRPHQQPEDRTGAPPPLSVPVMTPSEFFYTDPTMRRGQRVPNIVTELQVFECFQLNTPRPIMSSCPAPPVRPDPFRSQAHPTRDLGGHTWRRDPPHLPITPRPRERGRSQAVIQLSLEEDQAITNLLKLHHQKPAHPEVTTAVISTQVACPEGTSPVDHTSTLSQPSVCQSIPTTKPSLAEEMGLFHREDQLFVLAILEPQHQNEPRLRSDVELEAANALLTMDEESVSLVDDEGPWNQTQTLDRPSNRSPENLHLQYFSPEECDGDTLPLEDDESCLSPEALPPMTSIWDAVALRNGTVTESEGTAVDALLILGDLTTPCCPHFS
ncbi:uncharacterized protein LOC129864722 [Salvelinus fontinalis]|uniref:uncharacterized protein LOC129864722 n=1 Tax=Salvelinus fontinalis TaxID=8038 RepID=UPI0024850DCA|nr:uncharacterized protein LOC129864722 [Salvelinus fontinalis]